MANILGISPGTRSIGIAMLLDGELIDWDIRIFQEKWSDSKLITMLDWMRNYIEANEIESIAIKLPNALPTSQNFIKLISAINDVLEGMDVHISYYVLSDIKNHFCSNKNSNKDVLAECVVAKYPKLVPDYFKEQTNLNSYYGRVFEAAAVSRLLYDQLYLD